MAVDACYAADPPVVVLYGGAGAGYLKQFEAAAGVTVRELTDNDIVAGRVAAAAGDVLIMLGGGGRGGGQLFTPGGGGGRRGRGVRRGGATGVAAPPPSPAGESQSDEESAASADKYLAEVLQTHPQLRVVTVPAVADAIRQRNAVLADDDRLVSDVAIDDYVGRGRTSRENLRRLLTYVAVTYTGAEGSVEPSVDPTTTGFYHPDYGDFFSTTAEFLAWSKAQGRDVEQASRVVVLANYTHFVARNQAAIDEMLREFGRRGAIAACVIVEDPDNRSLLLEFQPQVAIDAFHRGDEVEFRQELNIPHLYAMWLSRQTIEEWLGTVSHVGSYLGVENAEVNGSIEPHVVAGRSEVDGVDQNLPIPDRIDRIVSRALAWAKLSNTANAKKRVAMLVSGAPGGDLDVMASLSVVLGRLRNEGYVVEGDIAAAALSEAIDQHVEQLAPSETEEIDALARSGHAALVPAETYRKWLDAKVPEEQRKQLVAKWGEAPGNIMVWHNDDGQQFLVIPKFDLGNVALVAKPRPSSNDVQNFDAHKHDHGNPPSHNILATYFWLQETYRSDALVVWGMLTFDLLVPGKAVGQSRHDWPDILLGNLPNVRPYGLGSLSFALPAKRRAKAVLVDYLPPLRVAGELDDDLQNLQGDLVKWQRVSQPGLKERFASSISDKVYKLRLDKDLHIAGSAGRLLSDAELAQLAEYLAEIEAERVPLAQHVLGVSPPRESLPPYLVSCLGRVFLDELSAALPAESDDDHPLSRGEVRKVAAEILRLHVEEGFSVDESLGVAGVAAEDISPELDFDLAMAVDLFQALGQCELETDRVVAALAGRFVPPGPSSTPERNPAAVPTGRNMYVMNPEEIPTKPSWELGKTLIDDLLQQELEAKGEYPRRIAFTIHTRGTMSDFGVSEAQILYALGVRPIWDRSGRVLDVELIPADELGRPRIDVFIEPKHYYAEYLESRMRLIDKAVRLVAVLDEPHNRVFANRNRIRAELLQDGLTEEDAETLSYARIFDVAPERFGSGLHDRLFESTQVWDTEGQLVDVYVAQHDFAYTEGRWGQEAPQAFKRQISDADIVMRTLTQRGALEGRAHYSGGMLSLVTKVLCGNEPDYYLSDVRYAGEERVLSAHDAVRRDLRSKLFNRKWIEAQMRQGRGGAFRIAGMTEHALGFRINSSRSVSDDVWETIVEIYLRDSKGLRTRDWLETRYPAVYQELTKTLLETIRKGYWPADAETAQEIAAAYAGSVVRDGADEEEDNAKLHEFVTRALSGATEAVPADLAQRFRDATVAPVAASEPAPPVGATAASSALSDAPAAAAETVSGPKLVEAPPQTTAANEISYGWAVLAAVVLIGAGYFMQNRDLTQRANKP